ncbi:hypothetical protein QNO00_15540 [Arthrobacter sp. zg-Y1219]|uniref:hypothetical protein n=1 Tax=Arthrobacter sp. zg-Y1219 TaxID=3049067 RepID=UPI0024C267B2|nr:hypothetical protein [Arthrobacter sp. zg-Y1219]MDK1361667.1 hypothetical protein [Arthrobacter sp. zg-Y1219]
MPSNPPSASGPHGSAGRQDYGNVPVIISAVLAAVAGVAVALFSTGGTERDFRWELGVAAACVTFIVSLLIFLLLIVTARPNPENLGKGTGIRRSFGSKPGAVDDDDRGFRPDDPDPR